MKHDVDYNVKVVTSPNEFMQIFEDGRLSGLAHLESLHQFLEKNESTAYFLNWDVKMIRDNLEKVLETLRGDI